MAIKYIDQIDIDERRILIRVDYNVPYDKNMIITDDTRIKASLQTLEYCINRDARIVLISHLGRPKGKVVQDMSLHPVAKRLSELISKEVKFVDKAIGDESEEIIYNLKGGEIALLENIRFYPEEERNDDNFAKKLARLGEVYINDAFATAHRAHASNEAITRYVDVCAAGFLLKDEIEYLKKVTTTPTRPLLAIIGGAKISSKLDILKNLLDMVDQLIIGGGMAFTFLKAKGYNIGKSLLEEELIETAKEILNKGGQKILLPVDVVVAPAFENEAPKKTVSIDHIPNEMIGLDIGASTIELFCKAIKQSKTVVWNGPMGAFEMPSFASGTDMIAQSIAKSNCLSIVGGGDSITALNKFGLADKMTYISTGGGAFLELLEGKTLPAIAALDR